jgi:steroid delta-isomerase-like uncharacterized protein
MPQDVKESARRWWEDVFNAHRLDRLEDWVAGDAVNHNAMDGTPNGPEGMRRTFERLFQGFPDMHFECEEMIADGGKVACVGTMSGTHTGEFMGMKPSGRYFEARHIHVISFDDERRMCEHLAVRDDMTMLQQLGLMPAPPQQVAAGAG